MFGNKLIPIEVNKIDSDRVIDFLIYKKLCVLNKKSNVFVGKHDCRQICELCLNSYRSRDVLISHMQKCGLQEITS